MPVFDFNASKEDKEKSIVTYEIFRSAVSNPSPEEPIMIIDVKSWPSSTKALTHHSLGIFTNPVKRTSFEFETESGVVSADILKIDARFVNLCKWLGENHIKVRLSGQLLMMVTMCVR